MPDPNTPETPAETPQNDAWYAKDEFSAEQLPVVSRYKDRASFNKAFFEQRHKISEQASPPDPAKLKPDEYLAKLKEYRSKAGVLIDPKAAKIVWPKDVAAYVEGRAPTLAAELASDAAEFGLTQLELDGKVAKLSDLFRQAMKNDETAKTDEENAKNKAAAEADKKLKELWGDTVETNTNNAVLFAGKMDETLLFQDNEALSEGERADRGGLLAQDLRNMAPEVRQRFVRLFNNLWGRLYAESAPTDIEGRGPTNLYNDRLSRVKQRWPNRPELWDQLARSSSAI
jgi:hypothetical protein